MEGKCFKSKVCSPISELKHVWSYTKNPPKWINQIVDIKPRSNFVIKNTSLNCHTENQNFTPPLRLDRQSTPRTLVCHDMKGGYVEDKYIQPVSIGNGYTFYHWAQIDVFVYFSHHLITIPPLCWINTAHNNGVKILGTFITEWKPGKDICDEIFLSPETIKKFVNVLVDICVLFKLDGWLLNIENNLDNTEPLKCFIKQLTTKIHKKRPGSLIIWYDSVIDDGKLVWQNELNAKNKCYFDDCDGIFINYSWKEENLVNTLKAAEHRYLDVYVGVDVFGRNFYEGGKFNTYLAVEKIREYNLSIAVFAQGWTHETLDLEPANTFLERFLIRNNAFWKSLWQYLYTHPINAVFETLFYVGTDNMCYQLSNQQTQLSQCLDWNGSLRETAKVSTLHETCNCLQLHFNNPYTFCLITNQCLRNGETFVHRLFSCNINVASTVVFYFYVKGMQTVPNESEVLNVVLLIQNANGVSKKIICYYECKNNLTDNLSLMEVNYSEDHSVTSIVSHEHEVPSDWILRCYVLNISDSYITDIGAMIKNDSCIYLCGMGIKEIKSIS